MELRGRSHCRLIFRVCGKTPMSSHLPGTLVRGRETHQRRKNKRTRPWRLIPFDKRTQEGSTSKRGEGQRPFAPVWGYVLELTRFLRVTKCNRTHTIWRPYSSLMYMYVTTCGPFFFPGRFSGQKRGSYPRQMIFSTFE